jgi:hypothetical protein
MGTKWGEKSVPQDVYVRQSFNLQEFFEVNAAVRRLPSHVPCAYKHPARSSNAAQFLSEQSEKSQPALSFNSSDSGELASSLQ